MSKFILIKKLISTFKFIFKSTKDVSKKMLELKTKRFLFKSNEIHPEFRKKEIKYLEDSNKYKNEAGEMSRKIINEIESEDKMKFIGILYSNYISQNITFEDYKKLENIINKISFKNLIGLINYDERYSLFEDQDIELFSLGLCEDVGIGTWEEPTPKEKIYLAKVKAKITPLGKKLVDFGLKEN